MAAPESQNWSDFEVYLKKNFPEHAYRIGKARFMANVVRIVFPICSFIFPAFLSVIIACFVNYSFLFFEKKDLNKFLGIFNLSSTYEAAWAVGIAGFLVSMVFFFIGLLYGFSKARRMSFETEKLKLAAMQLWLIDSNMNAPHILAVKGPRSLDL